MAIGKVKNIFVIPGNPGIEKENKVQVFDIQDPSIQDYINFAQEHNIDLTIVGPEAPLVDGIVDEFEKNGLLIFGPTKNAIEGNCTISQNWHLSRRYPEYKGCGQTGPNLN